MITFIIFATIFALFFVYYNAVKKHYDSQKQEVPVKQQEPEIDWQRKIQNVSQLAEALVQADIVGDHLTADRIKRNDYDGPLPERRDDGGWLSIYDNLRILKIAGINHRQGINRYVGRVECALVPEPDNEYDPDAIKIVAEDRHHLGYIPSGQTEMVCWLTANEFPYRCTSFIEAHEDETDGHKFFTGFVYIKRLD
jgi:hypothetical protein